MIKNILLVRPPAVVKKGEMGLYAVPPIGLAYIAGTLMTRGFHCQVIDAIGESLEQRNILNDRYDSCGLSNQQVIEKIRNANTIDLIGVSCSFTKEWINNKLLLEDIKQLLPHIPIVCGGEHITAEPEFSMTDCEAIDYCVLGEGEEILVDLINHLNEGVGLEGVSGIAYRDNAHIRFNERRKRITAIDNIPLPRWDLVPIGNYLDKEKSFGVNKGRSMPLLATRGCPFKCTFCSSPNMWTTRWIARNPELVIREIEEYIRIYNATNFDFYDLTAIVKKEWILQFARLIIDKKLNISWQLPSGTRSEAIDQEVCHLLYESGCKNLSYSPESASVTVLRRIDKKIDLEKLTNSIKSAVKCGLNVKVNLIFGFPQETHKDILDNLKYILKLSFIGANDLSIWSFAPYPGSKLFAELKQSGKINLSDDAYINSLIYSEMIQQISWNDQMSVRWVNFYRTAGVCLFYLSQFTFRPQRIFRIFYNLVKGRQESRSEKFIAQFLSDQLNKLRRY